MLGPVDSHQLEVCGSELEVGREIVVGPATTVGFLEVLSTRAGFAAPEFLRDCAEEHVVDLGDADQAAEAPVLVVELDDVAGLPSPVIVLPVWS